MNNLLGWMMIGLMVVLASRYLLRIDQPLGPVVTLALGISGAVVGGFLAQFVDMGMVRSVGSVDWVSLVITIVSAFIVILLIGILRR